ncbi:hypothetical protein KAU40_01630 [Candidatus Parcubacteria bacterium]|nr:hypothetical protein [Candidatus Parcubacteria bacterium]
MVKKKRLIIIDSNSVIHRAYHALPPLTTKKGELVNAIYGFLLVFLKAIKEFEPDYIAACFDVHAPTFRNKLSKQYKAKRPKAPKELYEQIPKIKEILRKTNITVFEKPGYEADDLIATIAKKAPQKQIYPEIEIYIFSADLDVLQLVNKNTKIYSFSKGIKKAIVYGKQEVVERFGVLPKQIVDFKALAGDAADNIPGATGIGKKTASQLLQKFNTIENLFQIIEKNDAREINPRIKEILIKNKDQIFLSQQLAQTRQDAPIDFNLEQCQSQKFDRQKAGEIFKDYGFHSLAKRLYNDENNNNKVQGLLL